MRTPDRTSSAIPRTASYALKVTRFVGLSFVWTCAAIVTLATDGPGKIWLDLKLAQADDTTSAVTAWPDRSDIAVEPANETVAEAAWRVLTTFQTASPAGANSAVLPRLGQGGEEFIQNLQAALGAHGFTLVDGFDISDQATPPKARFGIGYTSFVPIPIAPDLPGNFEVWVRTSLLPPDAPARTWSIREIAALPAVQAYLQVQRGNPSAPAAAPEIPAGFTLILIPPTAGSWLRPTADDRANPEKFTPIFAVAVAAAEEAVRQDILHRPRTEANRLLLAAPLRQSFSSWRMAGEVSFVDELSSVDPSYLKRNENAWVLRLMGFDPVSTVSVSIDEMQLGSQGRQPWAMFLAHQQAEGKAMDALIAQKATLEQNLTRSLNEQLPWGTPHFATSDDHAARITALMRQPGVAAVESKVFRDQVAYSVVWYPVLTTLEASGTYNSDRGGNLSSRLSVQTRDLSIGVEGYLANRRRGLFGDITTTPKVTHLPDQAMMTWGVLGEYTRESPVRLGTPKIFSLTDDEARAGLRWRLEGAHTNSAPAPTRVDPTPAVAATRTRRWKLEVIAGYRRARLAAENFTFLDLADGDAPFGSAEFVGEWDHTPGAAPGTSIRPDRSLHVEFNADSSPGHGATAAFSRAQLKLSGDFLPGTGRWENSLVRLTASGGGATNATPVAWSFRLGGDERMRGFELGELAGRSFFLAGIEAGTTVGSFLRRVPAGSAPSQSALPFDIRQIRVMLGVERAWLSDPPRFLPAAEVLRGGASYALTGEYAGSIPGLPGNSRLALGYGYAPRSSHRSGRVFVTLRVPLSIPQPP